MINKVLMLLTRYIEVLMGMGRSCHIGYVEELGLKTICVLRIQLKTKSPEKTERKPKVPSTVAKIIPHRHFLLTDFMVNSGENRLKQ